MTDPLSTALSRLCLSQWAVELVALAPADELKLPCDCGGLFAVLTNKALLRSNENANRPVALHSGEAAVVFARGGATIVHDDRTASQVSSRQPNGDREPDRNSTRIVFARFSLTAYGKRSFVNAVPEIVQVVNSTPGLDQIEHLIKSLDREAETTRGGWTAIAECVTKLLVLHALRAHLTTRPDGSRLASWLNAAMHPTIGPVVALIHTEPEKPWTVDSLAKTCAMAKSAFSDRFRAAVGESPLQYVTGYRMQLAQRLLSTSELDIREIATRVGYESGSSFSNAFKRLVGQSPANYRKQRSSNAAPT